MRRWNGWGEESVEYPLSASAADYIAGRVGPGVPQKDARLDEVKVPGSRLPDHPLVSKEGEDRVRHSRGQNFADLVALRSGEIGEITDGVGLPEREEEVAELLAYAHRCGARVIPWGGGTSVVGGVNPLPGDRPVLTISLERMGRLRDLDEESRLATFEAGVRGPWAEAQLRALGYTLGHYPQSFEYSTLGGWVATRSSGQQSLGYGRIEDLFRGGRALTAQGRLKFPPLPASAAGPDLRQFFLGSEGRLGVLTEAVVRVRPEPEEERFWGVIFPGWREGLAAVRRLVQDAVPLSMVRLSDPEETRSQLHLSLNPYVRRLLEELLARRGLGDEKCLLILAATGTSRTVREARSRSRALVRSHGGVGVGDLTGREWRNSRFRLPYLRNTLWEYGWAVETLETATTWSQLYPIAQAVLGALRTALYASGDASGAGSDAGERVLAMCHVSHAYPTGASLYFTVIFRLAGDREETLERWRALKTAASRVIVERGATISHHHGVGVDHQPYLEAEKGKLGLQMLEALIKSADPHGMLNPGKLLSRNGENH